MPDLPTIIPGKWHCLPTLFGIGFRLLAEGLSFLRGIGRIDLFRLNLVVGHHPNSIKTFVLQNSATNQWYWFEHGSSTNSIDWSSKNEGGFSLAMIAILNGLNCCVRPPKHTSSWSWRCSPTRTYLFVVCCSTLVGVEACVSSYWRRKSS